MTMPKGSWIVAAFAAGLAGLLCTGAALAAGNPSPGGKTPPQKPVPDTPMKVRLVRSADSACELNCPEWIAAEGQIVGSTLGQFRKAIAQAGARRLPVVINSGGGLAEEGM